MIQNLILASASPRRKQLLTEALPNVNIHIEPADIDETRHPNESAEDYVSRMASEKARHVAEKHPNTKDIILAADTIVVHQDEILGKPADVRQAQHMLSTLSNDQHTVMTAVSLIKEQQQTVFVCKTIVRFAPLSPEQIQSYIDSGEPMDKAGAYGIQGKAAAFVEWIQGSYTNVVGLPLAQTLMTLDKFTENSIIYS